MQKGYSLACDTITAKVISSESHGGWDVVVQLVALTAMQHVIDEEAAKHTAIILARNLCANNNVTPPSCLDNPSWVPDDAD